jgi:hypothetical protein
MTVKVNYDTETTLVKGYYPDAINYSLIPEPYIEISDEKHQEALGEQMCVVNGVCQEYVKPFDVQLQEAKASKIAQCKTYLISTDWQVIRLSDPSSGEPLKEGVSEKRALARSLQVDIAICTTLEELNNINIDFS